MERSQCCPVFPDEPCIAVDLPGRVMKFASNHAQRPVTVPVETSASRSSDTGGLDITSRPCWTLRLPRNHSSVKSEWGPRAKPLISTFWSPGWRERRGNSARCVRPRIFGAAVRTARFGQATSSSSSKLIHGGLRYLEQYEFRLVREALPREVLLRAAPHIVEPLRFVLPHSGDLRPGWLIRLGLKSLSTICGARKTIARVRTHRPATQPGRAPQPKK